MAPQAAPELATSKAARRAVTPVAGAVAGIIFAVLFTVSVTIFRQTAGDLSSDTGAWLSGDTGPFKVALGLLPFAGLAFIWFIAVARERLGSREDQFFSTVFITSGTLFLAMVFAGAAAMGGLVAAAANDPAEFAASTTYSYARQAVGQLLSIFAVRMAAIFLLSQAVLWLRTKVMPRWMALLAVLGFLVLMFVYSQAFWLVLVFPAWVGLVSVYILITHLRGRPTPAGGEEPPEASRATS
jgi:hypothetical protein